MQNFTNAEKKLFLETHPHNLTLTFEDGTILQNEDIYYESMNISQILCSQEQLTFGECNATSFGIKIYNIPKSHKGQKMTVKLNIENSEFPLGTYYVESDDLTDDKHYRDIFAYDVMYKILNTDVTEWYKGFRFTNENEEGSSNVYTASLIQFRNSFINYIKSLGYDFEFDVNTHLINDDIWVYRTLDGDLISGQTILSKYCEINAVFGTVDFNNKLKFVDLSVDKKDALYPSEDLLPSEDLFPTDGFDKQVETFRNDYILGTLSYQDWQCENAECVQIRLEENDVGVTVGSGNKYVIQDNFLCSGREIEELENIGTNFLTKARKVYRYNPTSLQSQCKLWLELGDYIKIYSDRDILVFPILERQISGIQALKDTYSASGVKEFAETQTELQEQISRIRFKSNVLEDSIDETKRTITEFQKEIGNNYSDTVKTQSMIDQKANEIQLSVSEQTEHLQNQIDGNISVWYSPEVPTLYNFPAYEWTTSEIRNRHIGDILFLRDNVPDAPIRANYKFLRQTDVDSDDNVVYSYGWQVVSDTEASRALNLANQALTRVEKNEAQIDIAKNQILSTVSKEQKNWDLGGYEYQYSGYADPNTLIEYTKTQKEFNGNFLNVSTGKLYEPMWSGIEEEVIGGFDVIDYNLYEWDEIAQLESIDSVYQTMISQNEQEILLTASKGISQWDETVTTVVGDKTESTKYDISYYGFYEPTTQIKYPTAEMNGKFYLNQTDGKIYVLHVNDGVLNSSYIGQSGKLLDEVRADLEVTAEQISSKVSKCNVRSEFAQSAEEISIESGIVRFKGTTFRVNSNNFNVNDDGSVSVSGNITATHFVALGGTGDANNFEGEIKASAPITCRDMLQVATSSKSANDTLFQCQGHAVIHGSGQYTQELYVSGSGGASGGFHTASDKRLKHNIQYMDDSYEVVFDSVEPATFIMNEDVYSVQKTMHGFIAQDVKSALDKIADSDDYSLVSDRGDGMFTLSYDEMMAILWGEVKRLKKRVIELEKGEK